MPDSSATGRIGHSCRGAKMTEQITRLLTEHGFKLHRERKHRVFRHDDGRVWVMPKTPSDHHGLANNYRDLQKFLRGEMVRGSLGLTAISDEDRTKAEQILRGTKPVKQKQIRERNIGIAVERFKTPSCAIPNPAPIDSTEKPKKHELDQYAIGRMLHDTFTELMVKTIFPAETKAYLEDIKREYDETLETHIPALRTEFPDVDIATAVENYTCHMQDRAVQAIEKARQCSIKTCIVSTRLFQRATRSIRKNEPIDPKQIREALRTKIAGVWGKPHDGLADILFATGLFVLKTITDSISNNGAA